ncbi:MAG: response regulator [Ideonella sp.]|nr:response regulator [Ideonella sp.]
MMRTWCVAADVRTLASERCVVETARNGFEALQRMQDQRCEVVLLDLRMPGMGGMNVLKAIKARWPECEVIIITGHPMLKPPGIRHARRARLFAKPVGPDEVISATNKALLSKRWALRREPSPAQALMH